MLQTLHIIIWIAFDGVFGWTKKPLESTYKREAKARWFPLTDDGSQKRHFEKYSFILWNSLAFMEITQFIWKMKLTLCRCRHEGAKARTKPICFTRAISHFRIKNSKIVMFVWWCAHCKYVLHLLKASFLQLSWKCDAIPQNDQSTMCKTWTLKMFALNNSL